MRVMARNHVTASPPTEATGVVAISALEGQFVSMGSVTFIEGDNANAPQAESDGS